MNLKKRNIERFIRELKESPQRDDVFNPWWEKDEAHDRTQQAPAIRRRHLRHYLLERLESAKFLLLAEAVGYQGAHFSGVPMTSERILLGALKEKNISPEMVATGVEFQRTSQETLRPNGFTEPTATIVWGEIVNSGLDPREIILWNAYPWHPFKPAKGRLSNRTPGALEALTGKTATQLLLKMTNIEKVIAAGAKAESLLLEMGLECKRVRHPANGGATRFREEFRREIKRKD